MAEATNRIQVMVPVPKELIVDNNEGFDQQIDLQTLTARLNPAGLVGPRRSTRQPKSSSKVTEQHSNINTSVALCEQSNNIVVAGDDTTTVSEGGQHLFAIGYIFSFVAAGVFYWLFNRLSPHHESKMDMAETGEDIIAANDARNQEIKAGRKESVVEKMFAV